MGSDATQSRPGGAAPQQSHQPVRRLHAVADSNAESGGSTHPRAREAVNPLINPPSTGGAGEEGELPVWVRLRAWARPPNVRGETAPSWEQIAWRARYGNHVSSSDGWSRSLCVGWAYVVAMPAHAVAIWLAWVSRAPSRTAVALGLYLVVMHLPFLSWLPNPIPF